MHQSKQPTLVTWFSQGRREDVCSKIPPFGAHWAPMGQCGSFRTTLAILWGPLGANKASPGHPKGPPRD